MKMIISLRVYLEISSLKKRLLISIYIDKIIIFLFFDPITDKCSIKIHINFKILKFRKF